MAISKVIFKASADATPEVWMDATPATAGAADIMAPKTAMLADGVLTTGTGSGGGGIEYETGSVTLVTDATQLTISFSNSHLSRPMAFMLSASEDTMSINFNTSFIWTLLSYYDAFGLSIGEKYGRMQTIYSSSTGAATSQGTDLTSINGATASSLAYYCDNNAITPKSGNASRFFRAGITYDWVAVWPPTV